MIENAEIDFSKAAAIGLTCVLSWLPGGHMQGREYIVKNPRRSDASAGSFSINLETGHWADFADPDHAKGGDAVSLYAYLHDMTGDHPQLDAAHEILGMPLPDDRIVQMPIQKKNEWEPIIPAPDDAGTPGLAHYQFGAPAMSWCYKSAEGKTLFYKARYNTPDGKLIVPWTYCRQDEKRAWRMKGPVKPWPLYGLDRLAANPHAKVLLVEGEKCADAAASVLKTWVVATWENGAESWGKADWSPLDGRDVTIWPDNDDPGNEAAQGIAGKLAGHAKCRILRNIPAGKPKGWDVADAVQKEGMGETDLLNIIEPRPAAKYPFQALGYDHGTYFFTSGRTHDIICIPAMAMKKNMLLTLADMNFWETEFSGRRGVQWDSAVDSLIGMCQRAGKYDSLRIRGRGVWYDAGRIVLHLGDRLLVDGQPVRLEDFDSRFIYESGSAQEYTGAPPLPVDESKRLVNNVFNMLPWANPVSAFYLAGWCMIAPICGALEWRPHIWLTAPAGSGKTWVQEKIVNKLLGNRSFYFKGPSSEAGIRQHVGNDGMPIVEDEFEASDPKMAETQQNVLLFARQCSSESDAKIARGTQNGKGLVYTARSAFMFSSVVVALKGNADESRVTVISLQKNTANEFATIEKNVLELLTPEFCDRLRARAVAMIPTIRENARKIADAIARKSSQRTGDQLGALLAGCYALTNDGMISDSEADIFVSMVEGERKQERQETSDEDNCLQTIIQATIRTMANRDMSVGELIAIATGKATADDESLSPMEAGRMLLRHGIRVMDDGAYIATSHDGVRAFLKNTVWGNNYDRMLIRIKGCDITNPIVFTPGVRQKAIKVPVDWIISPK